MRDSKGNCILALACVVAACRTHEMPSTELGRARQALALQLGEVFDVEAPPTLTEGSWGEYGYGHLACGELRCALAYGESIGNRTHAFVAFTGGEPLGLSSPRTAVARGYVDAVGALGDTFLVGTRTEQAKTLTLVRGTDGIVTRSLSMPNDGTLSIAGSGSSWGVLTEDGVDVLDATSLGRIGGFGLTDFADAKIYAGPGQFLVVRPGQAIRVDAATGARLDAVAISLSAYSQGVTDVVAIGDIYHLIWRDYTDVLTARLRASDGTMLDADDDFNQLTGGRTICTGCASDDWNPADDYGVFIAHDGSNLVAAWAWRPSYNDDWCVGRGLLDSTTGLPTSLERVNCEELGSGHEPLDMGMLSGRAFVSRMSGWLSGYTIVTDSPTVVWTSSGGGRPYIESVPREDPRVASNGTDFLVVWRASTDIYATRVSGSTGAYLDDPPLLLSDGNPASIETAPVVAALGTDYVAGWFSDEAALQTRAVSGSGTLGAVITTSIDEAWNPATQLCMSSDGAHVLIAWRQDTGEVRAHRVDATGNPLEYTELQVGAGPGRFWIAPDVAPEPDLRTFLVGWSGTWTSVVRVRGASGSVIVPETVTSLSDASGAACGAPGCVVLSADSSESTLSADWLDPVTGETSGETLVLNAAIDDELYEVWFDGASFLTLSRATSDVYNYEGTVRRYGTVLSPLEAAGTGTRVAEYFDVGNGGISLATSGDGRTLVAYSTADTTRFGLAIKARFLENDGSPAPSSGGTGGGGSGGTTASGGLGGVVTAGGSGTGALGGAASAGTPSSGGTAGAGGGSSAGAPSTGGGSAANGGSAGVAPTGGATATGGAPTAGAVSSAGSSAAGDQPGSEGGSTEQAPAASSERGCGCSTERKSETSHGWLLLALLGVVIRSYGRAWRERGGHRPAEPPLFP